jgi:hypothetical protein
MERMVVMQAIANNRPRREQKIRDSRMVSRVDAQKH